jgi:hypothetical protein
MAYHALIMQYIIQKLVRYFCCLWTILFSHFRVRHSHLDPTPFLFKSLTSLIHFLFTIYWSKQRLNVFNSSGET